jgi:tRNA threonylcarbamoyladenosine biosynthesis protein TsaB
MDSTARHTTVLGFDTSTADLAVAATRGDECIRERLLAPTPGSRPRHAEELLGEVERAASEAGGWERVDLVAVGVGPGSYTGLRVGIATARAIGQALSKPIAGVCSLAALARGIAQLPFSEGRSRLAVIDARRSEIFAALHHPDGRRTWGPVVAAPATLAERLAEAGGAPLAAGDGALRFRRDLEQAGAEVLPEDAPAHRVSARHVCRLAEDVERFAPREITPIYLRPPDAEIWRERDRGQSQS